MGSTNQQAQSPHFVPSGTPDNSPPIHRWETQSCQAPAPSGATETLHMPQATIEGRRVLSSLTGLVGESLTMSLCMVVLPLKLFPNKELFSCITFL